MSPRRQDCWRAVAVKATLWCEAADAGGLHHQQSVHRGQCMQWACHAIVRHNSVTPSQCTSHLTDYNCNWLVNNNCSLSSVLWCCWLGGRKGIRPLKNWVVGCWRGYLSGARCRLAYGSADATATHCLVLQWNPDWFYLSGTGSPG